MHKNELSKINMGKSILVDCDNCQNKRAWKSIIPAEDLDKHMAAVGQAQANAKILQKMLIDFPIEPKTNILVPGCGTGQIFDYLDVSLFKDFNLIFSDINKEYLNKLDQRLKKIQKINYKIIEDDIETIKIRNRFDSCIIILLLEHVNWQQVLLNIVHLKIKSIYLIIQKQGKNQHMTTEYKDIPLSIKEFSKLAKSKIILESVLKKYLKKEGFNLLKKYKERVLDNKEMVGIFFSK